MAFYWLARITTDEDGVETVEDTLDLGANVQEITLGDNRRDYKVTAFAGSAGGYIRGFGTPGSKKFKVGRQERVESGDTTAWNSRRTTFMKWFTRTRTEDIFLYIRDGEDTFTVRTLVYCTKIGADKIKQQKITDIRSFELISPKGIYENIVADTDSEAVTTGDNTVSVSNDGMWETPIICKFTPTGDETKFGVQITDQFGFVLEKNNFDAGLEIVYDTSDNSLTIDGGIISTVSYLTAGGIFMLPPGDTDLTVTVSGAGTFEYEFTERYS